MPRFKCPAGASGDLFAGLALPRREAVPGQRPEAELVTARLLCRRLRTENAGPDKKRVAHLICLNLVSMLKHGPRRS